MVIKQNKKSCTDESYQCSYKHTKQVDSRSDLSSCDEFMGDCEIPNASEVEIIKQAQGEIKPVVDCHNEHLVTADKDYRIHMDVMFSDDLSVGDSESLFNFSRVTNGSDDDLISPEPNKRPLGDSASLFNFSRVTNGSDDDLISPELSKRPLIFDESCERTWKRARQVNDLSYIFCIKDSYHDRISETPHISDADLLGDANKDANEKVPGNSGDLIGNYPHGISNMSWDLHVDSDNVGSDPSMRVSPAECSEKNHPSNQQILSENVHIFFWDYYPQKHVALGPDHQVNIPACRSEGFPDANYQSMEKFIGTCVIPMPDASSEVPRGTNNGQGLLFCGCSDQGSVNCVRRHVSEAREEFRETVGSHKFAELGFCDMGEDVALKWTEEEEQVFHQVVLAHPASLGKNFWNVLPQVFPSRSSKDIVSYYFNVFILRKRAAQNRCDPVNVDSDNDEWHETDDRRFNMEDYEEDSVVESPIYHEGVYEHDDREDEEDEEEEPFHVQDDEEDVSDDYGVANNGNEQGDADFSVGCVNYKSGSIPNVEAVENNSHSVEHDFQDDSCTSYEVQHSGGDSRGPNEISVAGSDAIETVKELNGECKNDALSHLSDPDYSGGNCEQKPWESYFSRSEKVVDFLPTCNVIEEVFGKGTWDNSARDGQGAV